MTPSSAANRRPHPLHTNPNQFFVFFCYLRSSLILIDSQRGRGATGPLLSPGRQARFIMGRNLSSCRKWTDSPPRGRDRVYILLIGCFSQAFQRHTHTHTHTNAPWCLQHHYQSHQRVHIPRFNAHFPRGSNYPKGEIDKIYCCACHDNRFYLMFTVRRRNNHILFITKFIIHAKHFLLLFMSLSFSIKLFK